MASAWSCGFWSAVPSYESRGGLDHSISLPPSSLLPCLSFLPPSPCHRQSARRDLVPVMAPIVISISVDPRRSGSIRFDLVRSGPMRRGLLLLSAALHRLSGEQWNALQIRPLTRLLGIPQRTFIYIDIYIQYIYVLYIGYIFMFMLETQI